MATILHKLVPGTIHGGPGNREEKRRVALAVQWPARHISKQYEVENGQRFREGDREEHGASGSTFVIIRSGTLCALLLCLVPGTSAATHAGEQKQVLLLLQTSGGVGPDLYANRLAAELRRLPIDVDLYLEIVDVNRFGDAAQDAIFADFLRGRYADISMDLVIAAGPGPLTFVTQHHESLYRDVPIIFSAVSETNSGLANLPPRTTGIVSHFNVTGTLDLARRLQPRATRLVVVTGAASLDRSWHARARKQLSNSDRGLDVSYLSGLPEASLLSELGRLPRNTIVLFLTMTEDGAGKRFIPQPETVQRISEASNAPVYGVYETYLGYGVVGGYVDPFRALGVATADLAERILGGENAANIPVRHARSEYAVDWRQMRRWHLDESLLPPGTEILYREPSIWSEHGWAIAIAVVVVILQAVTIGTLLFHRVRRRQAEAARRESELRFLSELAHLNRVATMGEFAASMAHELTQPLNAILSNADAAAILLDRESGANGELREIIEDVREDDRRAFQIIQSMRQFLKRHELVACPVDLNSLMADVTRLANVQMLDRHIKLTFQPNPGLPRVAGDRVHLQQVLMNLILNARDAIDAVANGRRAIAVSARAGEPGSVAITVSDTGKGIPESQLQDVFKPFYTTKKDGIGMGLAITRTIVEAHNGRVWVSNNATGGATFHITLPASPPDNEFPAGSQPTEGGLPPSPVPLEPQRADRAKAS